MAIEPVNQSTTSGLMDTNLKDRKLKEACKDFEAVLLDYMFQSMRKTLGGDSILGNSDQKDLYESMYYQEISKNIAKGKGAWYRGCTLPSAAKEYIIKSLRNED